MPPPAVRFAEAFQAGECRFRPGGHFVGYPCGTESPPMPIVRVLALCVPLAAIHLTAAAADCGCTAITDASVQSRTGWRTDWTVQLPVDGSRFAVMHVVVGDDFVIAQTSDGGVHLIDSAEGPTRGTIRWSRRIGVPYGSMHPASSSPTLVMVATDREVHGLRKKDGTTAFTERMPTLVEASPTDVDGFIYVPTAGGTIERLPADRFVDPSPNVGISSEGSLQTAPLEFGQKAFGWVTTNGTVVAMQPFSQSWQRSTVQLPSPSAGRPIVSGDDLFVATTVGDLVRLRLRQTTPLGLEPVWRMPLPGRPDGSMILDGETLFVSLGLDGLVALDARTGGIRWRANGAALRFREGMGLVAAGGGRLWCVDSVGRLSLLDASTGKRVGCVPLDGFTPAAVTGKPGRLVLARPDGRLTSLSPAG